MTEPGGQARPQAPAERRYSVAQRVIAAVLMMMLEIAPIQSGVHNVLGLGLGRSVHAAPVADPVALPRFQPGIGQTTGPAPVPVVNITAPNAAGASLNRYRQFNVDAGGVVLNNSATGGGTLLGGRVGANPLLNGRSASVIINEVGSGYEASAINGAIEVFGPRADLVVANPNGIACNGCGFVNTPRITLTTGALRFLDAPNGAATAFDSAAAWGYDVRGGEIRIGAAGGQAGIEGTVGQIDLIAESIALHAPLRAGIAANLVTGRQWVAYDAAGNVVVGANGDNSGAGYAIDASELGAVTAGRITIIATAAGPGVRADGRLAASAGDLLISANGDVSVARTYASGDLRAHAQGAMTLAGDALVSGDIALNAGRGMDTAALSAHRITLDAGGAIASGGMQSDTTIHAGAGGTLGSRGALTAAGAVTLAAEQDIAIGSGVHSGDALDILSRGGSVSISGDASAGNGVLLAAGRDIRLAGGSLASGTDTTALAGRGISIEGSVDAGRVLRLDAAAGDLAVRGALSSGADMSVHAGASLALEGKVAVPGKFGLDAGGTASLGGATVVAGNVMIDAGKGITLGGNLIAGGDITLQSAEQVMQEAGMVGAAGMLAVSGRQGVRSDGILAAGGSIAVSSAKGAVILGLASSGGDLTVSAAQDSTGMSLQALGNVQQTAGGNIVNSGMAIAGGTLVQHAGGAITQAGSSVGKGISATAGGDIRYSNTAVSGTLDLKSKQQITLAGTLDAGDTTLDAAGRLFTTDGVQTIRGTLSATAASMMLDADATSAGNAVYTARSGDLQGGGALQSGGDLTLKAGGRIERSKLVGTVGKLTVQGSQGVGLGDTIAMAGAEIASAGGDVRLAGTLGSGGDLSITAGGNLAVDKGVVLRGQAQFSAAGNVDINARVETLAGMQMNAGQRLTLNGDVGTNGMTTLTGADIVNQATVLSAGDLSMQARGSLASGAFQTGGNAALGGASVTMGPSMVIGDLAVIGGEIALAGETVVRGGASVVGRSLVNRGKLLTGNQLVVDVGTLTNDAGSLLFSKGDTTVTADKIRNAGQIAGANVTLASGSLDNSSGLVLGTQGAAVRTGTLDSNRDGKIVAFGDLLFDVTGAMDNRGGLIQANRDLTLQLHGATFDPGLASNGTLGVNGKFTVIADNFSNTGNWQVPGRDLDLQLQQSFINRGYLERAGNLRIATPAAIENTGQIVADGKLALEGASILNSGLLHANGDMTLQAANDIVNSGRIHAQQALTLEGAALDNRDTNRDDASGAGISAAGDMHIAMGTLVDNSAGRIAAVGDVSIVAPVVRNDRGALAGTIESGRNYNPEVLDAVVVETGRSVMVDVGGEGGGQVRVPVPDRTLGSYAPDYVNRRVDSPATIPGQGSGGEGMGAPRESVGDAIALPWVDIVTLTQREGRAGMITSQGAVRIDAPILLSNRGSVIAAAGDVTLNVGRLDNGRSATLTNGTVETVNPADQARFIAGMNKAYSYYDPARSWVSEPLLSWETHPLGVDKRYQTPGQRGAIVTGRDFVLTGPSLVNTGNITVGRNAVISAGASFSNLGDYNTQFDMRAGCISDAVSCNEINGAPRVERFSFRADPNTLAAGGSLTISAPVITNAHATLAARGDISLTADQINNVAGVIQSTGADLVIKAREVSNRVEAPVTVHESWGGSNPPDAPGCNPGGSYKDSQCTLSRDVPASPAPVLAAARDVVISGNRLGNIGGLISAGRKVDIDMRDASQNLDQALAIKWSGYWIEDTGEFHKDVPHKTGGTVALPSQIAAIQAPLVSVKVGGVLQNTGNIIGTSVDLSGAHLINGISAANQPDPPPTGMKQVTLLNPASPVAVPLSDAYARIAEIRLKAEIKEADAEIQRLRLEHPDQPLMAIAASSLDAANAKRKQDLADAEKAVQDVPSVVARPASGAGAPAPVATYAVATPGAGFAAAPRVQYIDNDAAQAAAVLGNLGAQQLLDRLPAELRGPPLPFAYDPFLENQMLQRQALESTGRAYYINGLSFDDRSGASLDDQQKALFYTNAINYAQTQRLAIGQPLSKEQVAALDRPMLWYVEQQVPDASCRDIGALSQANCPTVSALAPVLYLDRASTERLSTQSLGLIIGDDVVANFTDRIDNSGIISGGNIRINTPEMINTARQIDIGRAAYKVDGGWVEMTGTAIAAGGYLSAQNFSGEIERLENMGGALQKLNADGSVDVAGTEDLIARLGSVLGVESYLHVGLKDDIHTDFIRDKSDEFMQVVAVIAAVALSFIIGPAVSAYLGEGAAAGSAMASGSAATATSAAVGAGVGVGNIMVTGFVTGTLSNMAAQFIATGDVNAGAAFKSGLTGSLSAGLTDLAGLSQMAGIRDMGDGLLTGSFDAARAGQAAIGIGGRALIAAAVSTAINDGSFKQALLNSVAADFAALGANWVGQETDAYSPMNLLGHAAVGCAGALIGKGDCAASALGAAMSALVMPALRDQLYGGDAELVQGVDGKTWERQTYSDPLKNAGITSLAMIVGATAAGLAGKDPITAANAARNEAINNALSPKLKDLANAGPKCREGTCAAYVDALQTEKNSKQQEYDACMMGVDCSPAHAAELGSELFRLKSAYEQTVRQGVAVGDLKWVVGDNLVPTDYFDGLVGLGAVGVGAALRVGGAQREVRGGWKALEVGTEVNSSLKLGQTGFIDGIENTKVGRWMSADEAALMQSKGVVQQGAGGQTFVSINSANDFKGAAPLKSVYVEFNVPSNSLLQAGKDGWLKIIGPNAMESQKFMLQKQGGTLLPSFNDLKILESK